MSLIVELDERTADVVQAIAADEKRSASEVIRDALAAYAKVGKRPLPTGAGQYRSGRSDTSQKVDDILGKAVKEGAWP